LDGPGAVTPSYTSEVIGLEIVEDRDTVLLRVSGYGCSLDIDMRCLQTRETIETAIYKARQVDVEELAEWIKSRRR